MYSSSEMTHLSWGLECCNTNHLSYPKGHLFDPKLFFIVHFWKTQIIVVFLNILTNINAKHMIYFINRCPQYLEYAKWQSNTICYDSHSI